MEMDFSDQKLVVVGGSSGMGRETAARVVAAGGSAVIIGLEQQKVDETVKALAKDGQAHGITADLADRKEVDRICRQLAKEHAEATLLVNAAGLFVPKPFLDHDGADYDSYLELDRAIFFVTQTVVRGMIKTGHGGSIVNIGSMWAHQAIAATPSSAYSSQGRLARPHAQSGHRAGSPSNPRQCGGAGRGGHPDLFAVCSRRQG
jgi:NAD(P)-dependent dehydrogenase (short-subunit alcohol dehydrogenase family)